MKIKELQQLLDYLVKRVNNYPQSDMFYLILSIKYFNMSFIYRYNEIYGTYQVKIRFDNYLNGRNTWYDYIPKNIDSIEADILYTTFIAYVQNQLYAFKDDTLNQLRSGVVELNRSE